MAESMRCSTVSLPGRRLADGGSIKANTPAVGRGVSTMVSVIAGAGNQRELLLPAVAI
jgi:hypothetical protein